MSEHDDVPGRVRRAVGDHGSFAHATGRTFESVTTAFEGEVTVSELENGHIEFDIVIRVPMLSAVVEGGVDVIVEDGWYETFELRMEDVGGVTAKGHDLDPDVRRAGEHAVVSVSFSDINERRGVDDAAAVIDYAEGTFVQGIIPGYTYTEPVSGILDRARETAGTGF